MNERGTETTSPKAMIGKIMLPCPPKRNDNIIAKIPIAAMMLPTEASPAILSDKVKGCRNTTCISIAMREKHTLWINI